MSTNGITSWAVDLKDVGAIYPFQGTEVILVIAGVAFWILWHIVQMRQEGADLRYDEQHANKKQLIEQAIDEY
ncbi:hypothetical protein [Hyphomicrobium sp.]|uniref:hypothetical protein n=1 Tax=Hyphomicrobium sp. TaxID=82 RepID=UPI0025BC9692|nr:hypothetical protein [Hyphomicrobium sp.]MCC7251259.1 hypothetical protein [Hyphomicrobium sp.]